ncbi:hypothetical protein DENSPDRAFT_876792 [Dentipellis sp. KUC8613]|nr:hypothetical protein DENSPDRAFT_876792 [Dentipellis sp. KUC8613]
MSTAFRIGSHWRGYAGLKNVVVFGDSYSYVGYHSQAPPPTASKPLGVATPGTPVNEPGYPNWVGHLITSYSHGQSNMLVYDYAVRGDTTPGVTRQITDQFLPTVGRRPRWAAWSPHNSLFVTWIGISDCRLLYTNTRNEITGIMATLFGAQEQLYLAGARNFLFIDVPPVHRSPVGSSAGSNDYSSIFVMWNEELRRALAAFAAAHGDATVLLFSSWDTFTRVLDNPAGYGFRPQDLNTMGGSIWFDHIHPTTRFASVIARDIAHFLNSQPTIA